MSTAQPLPSRPDSPPSGRGIGVLLLAAGLVGLAVSGELAIEKLRLLENPLYVPPCSLGESVDCGTIMTSDQAEALFGIPNPFLGLAGFGGLLTAGLALVGGARPGRSFWIALQLGLTFAVLFVHWLIFQALYRIEAVCPFCMAMWAVTIPAFAYVTLRNLEGAASGSSRLASAARVLRGNHAIVVTTWLLLVAGLVAERFWAPWGSIFG
ncbi:vitamin K epoxide reductase family protein [Patulibacter brassicae]|uniref:Vitamin K epoxide reductase family protein n=1 Tax=Patulibacter brassicae TaxID=1705717 RepID=A0ABU4VN88_9ACTN|nr:vitamin K epoxide reductase family protein [Patulibacter brassicae]MDX8153313.1 vitamin K epoxide reductase family protein [Patulibacter brassicae]